MQAAAHAEEDVRNRLTFGELEGVGFIGRKCPPVILLVVEFVRVLKVEGLKGVQFLERLGRELNFLAGTLRHAGAGCRQGEQRQNQSQKKSGKVCHLR